MSVRALIFSPEFSDAPGRYIGARRKEKALVGSNRTVDPADQTLVTRIRECEEAEARAALDTLYASAYDRLVRFAMRLVDDEVAHDIVQDVFVSIWLNRAVWHAPTGSLAYCYSAVRNRALNKVRHQGAVQRAQGYLTNETGQPSAPSQDIEAAEFDAALAVVLAEFPERRRTAFLLRAVDGLGYDAIGAVLGISGPGAYKQVSAAIRLLRERLARFAG